MRRKKFPSGVGFDPSDEEMAVQYLDKKLKKQPLPSDAVKECFHVYGDKHPGEVFDPNSDDDRFYVFTKLKRVGGVILRMAGNGVWKHLYATQGNNADGSIRWSKREMIFIETPGVDGGSDRCHVQGSWLMQEFSLLNQKVDDYVLCKINNIGKDLHKKKGRSRENPINILDGSDEVEAVIAPSEDEIQCNHELPAVKTSNVLPQERRRSREFVPSREYGSYQQP